MNFESNKIFKILTITINIIFCLIFPISVIGAMVSPMAFDAPGSINDFYAWEFFIAAFSIPIIILISVITSLFLIYKFNSYKKALLFSLLPIINIIAIFISFFGH